MCLDRLAYVQYWQQIMYRNPMCMNLHEGPELRFTIIAVVKSGSAKSAAQSSSISHLLVNFSSAQILWDGLASTVYPAL